MKLQKKRKERERTERTHAQQGISRKVIKMKNKEAVVVNFEKKDATKRKDVIFNPSRHSFPAQCQGFCYASMRYLPSGNQ